MKKVRCWQYDGTGRVALELPQRACYSQATTD